MAYDPALIARLRAALGGVEPLTEKRMMGGACLMWGQHMLCGADVPNGGMPRFLFRVGPAGMDAALAQPGTSRMEMGRRAMTGYVFADAAALDDAALRAMLDLARSFVATLGDKPPRKPRRRAVKAG